MTLRAAWIPVLVAAACGTAAKPIAVEPTPPPPIDAAVAKLVAPAPDATRKLIDLDWSTVHPMTDAEALAIWQQIAPNGADWSDKLAEIPADLPLAHALAIALLHAGNFTCAPAPHRCTTAPLDIPAPAATAGLTDPCLRRLVALWALAQLEPDDAQPMRDSLLAIAAIPPPESELVAAALHAVPEADQDLRLRVLSAAWAAGQHELVNGALGELDEAHLIQAATVMHSDGALAILSAEANRAVYLAEINDDHMPRAARLQAIVDVTAGEEPLAKDSKAALVIAARGSDCAVAAAAARILDQTGDHRFVPRRPTTRDPAQMLRAVCVVAHYIALQRADERSPLATFLPPRGLEIKTDVFDPLVDPVPGGDPQWTHTTDVVGRDEATLPELDDFLRALDHCKGTTCASDSRTFELTFQPVGGALLLTRIELADRKPCVEPENPLP